LDIFANAVSPEHYLAGRIWLSVFN
jgi:hypothetical protein